MKLRSLLFVPGDSERKYDRAQASGADALILDLEVSGRENKAPQLAAQVADDVQPLGIRAEPAPGTSGSPWPIPTRAQIRDQTFIDWATLA